ncbi:MAG: glycosyltransferase family 1 protein [Bacteroidota bacterium]
MHKKRVGIDLAPVSYIAPGTARHVSEQAKALFKLDLPWDWLPTVESKENPLWTEIEHLSPLVLPGRKLWSRASFSIGRAWKNAGCQLGFCTAYFTPVYGIPVVTNYFDSNNFEFGKTWIDSGRRWNFYLTNLLSHYSLYKSMRLFVNSQYCIDVISKNVPQVRKKLIKSPPGVTRPLACPTAIREWVSAYDKPFFLYVGMFSENKNQHRLIQAWKKLRARSPECPNLVLVGGQDGSYFQEKIAPAISDLDSQEGIIIPGRVSEDHLIWLYHNAFSYIQPSIAEGLGIPILEAMSYGLPVACSCTTSLPETAGGAAIQFDPFSIKSIFNSLLTLSSSKKARSELIEKGSRRWQDFTWEKNAEIVSQNIFTALSQLSC